MAKSTQLLVLKDPSINSNNPVVFVVTQNDTIYAIDGTNCTILNSYPFLTKQGSVIYNQKAVRCTDFAGGPCGTIQPKVGILGTPVIDRSTGTIYLVTQSVDNSVPQNFYHYLHALDVQTLTELKKFNSPVLICPPPGTQCPLKSNFSSTHIQRPALLLANGYVYVAFSMMDGTTANTPPNGAVFGYQASDLSVTPQYFQTSVGQSNNSNGGGIWMGGAGPAFGPDGSGSNWIYVTTANGTFDQATNWGDSFLKLNPSNLTIATNSSNQPVGYLTPNDENWRQDGMCGNGAGDVDFGSGGVTLIPDNELTHSGYGYMAVNGEKEGNLWFIRRDVPGQFADNLNDCNKVAGGPDVQTYAVDPSLPITPVIHNNIAFWDSESASFPTKPFVYIAPQNEKPNTTPTQNYLYQFALCTAGTDSSPICGSTYSAKATLACCTYGTTPTISAASPQAGDAILWALEKTDGGCSIADGTCGLPVKALPVNGILYAFDALTLAPLYNSGTCPTRDQINQATKFSVPTVANGYVYVGTQSPYVVHQGNAGKGTLYIFGPTSKTCQ